MFRYLKALSRLVIVVVDRPDVVFMARLLSRLGSVPEEPVRLLCVAVWVTFQACFPPYPLNPFAVDHEALLA